MNNRPIRLDLERKLRKIAIPNLMKYIVITQGVLFALSYIWPTLARNILSLIILHRGALLSGQIWRIITFIFVPPSSSPIFIIFALYFYYLLGTRLEHQWGTPKFTLFYLIGMLAAVLSCLITGYADNSFLNLSLFFAYAAMWPDEQVLLFMIIPVKMKYLAILDAVLFLWQFITGSFSVKITILLSLANVFLFVGGDLKRSIQREIEHYKMRKNWR